MVDGAANFCVCALLYGADSSCAQLAHRLLNAPMRQLAALGAEFRIGMNAVSDETRQIVTEFLGTNSNHYVVDCPENILKYPMMRRLFYDKTIVRPYTMWFDDDSCIVDNTDVDKWIHRVQQQLMSFSIIGSVYKQRLIGNQAEWLKTQWWHTGKPTNNVITFVTGGWWAAQTKDLIRFNWPIPELKHRGGDVMLGELCHQNDLKIGHFRDQLWINANSAGVESRSPRRGYDERPIGADYAA